MIKKLNNKKTLVILLGIVVVLTAIIVGVFKFNNDDELNTNEIIFNKAGVYDEVREYDKVTITSNDVDLSNIKTKELIVSSEVGNGTVKLTNVEVTDNLEILGGGPNSVYINDSSIINININFSEVRVVLDNKTKVDKLISNEVNSLEIAGEVAELTLNKESVIKILETSKVNKLAINANMSVDIKANISSIKIADDLNDVVLETASNVIIDKLLSNSKVELNGLGKLLTIETNNKDNISGTMNIDNIEFEFLPSYIIIFNSTGGSDVISQSVFKNEKVVKPANPSRDGFTFVEWQLNDKTYNFDSEVVSDITLIAIWEKDVTSTPEEKLTTITKSEVFETKYETIYVNDKNLEKGTTKTVTNGINGSNTVIYEITTNSKGEEVSKKKIDEKIVSATNEVIHKGIADVNLNDIPTNGDPLIPFPVCTYHFYEDITLFQKAQTSYDFSETNIKGDVIDISNILIYYGTKVPNSWLVDQVPNFEHTKLQYYEERALTFTTGSTTYYLALEGCGAGVAIHNEADCSTYNLVCGRW